MRLRYDPESDVLMLLLSDDRPVDAVEEPGGVVVSYGDDRRPCSIEFLQASRHHLVEGGRIQIQVEQPGA